MKKILIILVMLFWCNVGFAKDTILKCIVEYDAIISIIINESENKIIFNGIRVKTPITWGTKIYFIHPDKSVHNSNSWATNKVSLDRITGTLDAPMSSNDLDHMFSHFFNCTKAEALF
mgnify:FL=1